MHEIPFKLGDVIISGGHSLMWVGSDKPIVHNLGGHGVIREAPGEAFRVAKDPRKFPVYRPDLPELGARAAVYAVGWSVESIEDDLPDFISPYDKNPKSYTVGAKTASGRYELASALQGAGQTDWTVESLYRVVKAVARKYHKCGLSPNHGVTCSQFITFCYQAAYLEWRFGHIINASVLDHLCQDRSSTKYLKLSSLDEKNPLKVALQEIKSTSLPVGLRVEPRAMMVDLLRQKLSAPNSGFSQAGYLVHQANRLKLWVADGGEREQDISLEQVLALF